MATLASALPENTGDGYVAGAYVVFFLLLLIYVAIMALRLSHMQRDLRDLQARTQESAPKEETDQGAAGAAQGDGERTLEREPA